VTYLDVWRSDTFPEKLQVSALPITNTDCYNFLDYSIRTIKSHEQQSNESQWET